MRVITHCPACQTQFFATEEQLNKHDGKVRCGQCMHVFDARAQLINANADDAEIPTDGSPPFTDNAPLADNSTPGTAITAETPDKATIMGSAADKQSSQPSFLRDAIRNSKIRGRKIGSPSRIFRWNVATLVLVLMASMQSMYFLRNEIALYYPGTKSYLIKACQLLTCSISLPKQIEAIVIDDSDMQEDTDHAGLVFFTSTLINTGSHALAYPNIELTLTDVDDTPVLRRIFKPDEYLPKESILDDGIRAGDETRIKLAITTGDIAVAGYRVFVTY